MLYLLLLHIVQGWSPAGSLQSVCPVGVIFVTCQLTTCRITLPLSYHDLRPLPDAETKMIVRQ